MQANYLAEAIFEKAQAQYSQKDYLDSLISLNNALQHLEVHQPPLEGKIYLLIAKCHFAMTQYREARKICQKALDICLANQLIALAAEFYQLSGQINCHQEHYSDAIADYLRGLSVLTIRPVSQEEQILKTNLHLFIGLAAVRIWDGKLGHKHFLQCYFIARRLNKPLVMAKSLLGLGCSYFQKQNYLTARQILLKAIRQFYQVEETHGIAHSLLILGQIYTRNIEYRRAVISFKYAYNLFEKNFDTLNQANSLVYLSRIFVKIDLEMAKHLCENINELLVTQTSIQSKRQSEVILARNYITMGMYYHQIEEIELALNFIKEGLDIFQIRRCPADYQEADELYQKLRSLEPPVKPRKNNILAFKLGIIS